VADAVASPPPRGKWPPEQLKQRRAFSEGVRSLEGLFAEPPRSDATERAREAFLTDFQKAVGNDRGNYVEAIQRLPPRVSSTGVIWLNGIVADWCEQVSAAVPSMNLHAERL